MKQIAKCRICKEPLHAMITFHGLKIGRRQCLNRNCRNYGKAVM